MKRSVRSLAAATIAASALATVWGAAPAQAQGAAAGAPGINVVSWNICGEAGGDRGMAGFCPDRDEPTKKIEQIKQVVAEQRADVVMLQEACGEAPGSHMDMLRTALGSDWSLRHAAGARPDGRTDCRAGLKGQLGIVLAVKGTITDSWSENALPADPTGASKQTLPVLCAAVAGWTTTPCTTHIVVGDDARARTQLGNVKAFAEKHSGANGFVLGGDFNRNGDAAVMQPMNAALDRCVNETTYHGWELDTKKHSYHSLDHFYATRTVGNSRFASCAVDRKRMDTTENEPDSGPPGAVSDHAPIIARLRGTPVPGDMNGDGKPDLVAVDDAGKLRLYRGQGDGGITGSPTTIGGSGWTGASVTHRGDFTGDGTEDVVARVGGEVRVYPNRGDGSLADPVRLAGVPTGAQVVSVGDLTGDAYPDLVASYDDKLWLYAGVPAAKPAVRPARQIGSGGWSPMTLTAMGDADHDGLPDLLARDTRDGRLWLYRGRPDGSFDHRTDYGHGYGPANRPLLAGAADADGNGTADLWTTTDEGTGTLMFYAGETNPAGHPVDGDRTTVGLSGWKSIRSIS
ncbi:FG-GAP-like repeat-containing protein [Streptomyces netropsis]